MRQQQKKIEIFLDDDDEDEEEEEGKIQNLTLFRDVCIYVRFVCEHRISTQIAANNNKDCILQLDTLVCTALCFA